MTEIELRKKVVKAAEYWLGRKESDESHHVIIDVYNSIEPLPRGYRMKYDDPWCAAFVSAVAQVCELTNIIYPECGCRQMVSLYQAAGRWMEDDAFLPEPGDLVFYDWEDDGAGDNTGSPDHVGMVAQADGESITVVEGNWGRAVAVRPIRRDGRFIRGYGLPDYAAAAASSAGEDETEGEGPAPGRTEAVELPTVRRGDRGEAVRAAQLLLCGRGFPVGRWGCDGDFGPDTAAALEAFRRSRGLRRSGAVEGDTWRRLICEE